MVARIKNEYGNVLNLEHYSKDGRLTKPVNVERYEWRQVIDSVKRLGRPLTEKEIEKYKIK